MLLEKIFALAVVVGCVVLLLRLLVGERRRQRLDATLRRWRRAARARFEAGFSWNARQRRARREADAAIRRARNGGAGEWEGNVYRPKSFRKDPDKDRKLH